MKAATALAPVSTEAGPWWHQSLGTGAPGIALRHIANARTGAGAWETAHRWAAAMTRHPVNAHSEVAGLFRGAPAVAFALHTADHPAYAHALTGLDRTVNVLVRERLARAHQRIDTGHPAPLREFDLIRGLTGLGIYLLHRRPSWHLLRDVLAYLVRLTEPLDGGQMPGWWSGDGPEGRPSDQWPHGHINFGLAHGIAGPLALLAAAQRRAIVVTGQAEAVSRIMDVLDQWQQGEGATAWWPGLITPAQWQAGTATSSGPQRPSWCYGTPGLARAQQVAALALGDPARQQRAERALAACIRDEKQLSQLTDASVCHGWAGLIQTVHRAAADDSTGELAVLLPDVHARMGHYLDVHGLPEHGGLLEGADGIHLASASVNTPPATDWDACLLLNG
ncbi:MULTISPECIES: lanthionine synthetase C family protein [Streptomyces]